MSHLNKKFLCCSDTQADLSCSSLVRDGRSTPGPVDKDQTAHKLWILVDDARMDLLKFVFPVQSGDVCVIVPQLSPLGVWKSRSSVL